MRKTILATLLAGTIAAPAFAQDAPVSAAGTGPRVEALLGYDAFDGDADGLNYGVGVGYDFTAGGATVGIEGEYTDTNADDCEEGVDVSGDELCAGLGRDLYVGGRVGAAVGTSSFIYAKAGYTNQRLRVEYDDGGNGNLDFNIGENLDGVRVGAGVEFGIPTLGLGSSAYLKGEYRYSNYEQGFDKHQAVAGIGFRF